MIGIPENTSNVKASPTGKSNKGGQRTPKKEKVQIFIFAIKDY